MQFNFDFSKIPTTKKVLPIIGLLAGLGFARYKKACVQCHIIAGIGGLVIGSLPLIHEAHEIAEANERVAAVSITSTEPTK